MYGSSSEDQTHYSLIIPIGSPRVDRTHYSEIRLVVIKPRRIAPPFKEMVKIIMAIKYYGVQMYETLAFIK